MPMSIAVAVVCWMLVMVPMGRVLSVMVTGTEVMVVTLLVGSAEMC